MTTLAPTTPVPTTLGPTTPVPTTVVVTTPPADLPKIACARSFHYGTQSAVARAWMCDDTDSLVEASLDPLACWMELFAEGESKGRVVGSVDPAGEHFVLFRLPATVPQPGHAYFLRVHLERPGGVSLGQRDFPMGTT